MSIFDKCHSFDRVSRLVAADLFPYFRAISDARDTSEVTFGDRSVIMIGSNNYLGLTQHPKVKQAARDALDKYGTGCSGSRFLNGTLELHHRLEERLAAFLGAEACVAFSTGFQTNLGVISVLGGRDDVLFVDRENHASIFEGTRLSFARIRKYRHNDMEDLERLLHAEEAENRLIITDGVFSMAGDVVKLPRLVALAKEYGAQVLVDDAHGIGVLGEGGRGTPSHYGVDVDLVTGTFSKSLASLGGFAAGPREVIDFVKYTAKAMIFSAALTPANAAAALTALEVIETEPEHRERLLANVEYMRRGLREIGFDVGDHPTAVLPVLIGDEMACFRTWKRLFENGIYTNPVVPPAVPPGQALLRTCYMPTHTRAQLDRCLDAFSRVGRELQLSR